MQTPTPHPSRSAPKCVDCRHLVFRSPTARGDEGPADLCGHPCAPVDPVTGNDLLSAADARQDFAAAQQPDGWCGSAGALFETVVVFHTTYR